MLIVNESAHPPYSRMIEIQFTYTCLTIKSEVYEEFVNPEEFSGRSILCTNYSFMNIS